MSGRPLLLITLPVITVLAICLYLKRRSREDADPPEPLPPDQSVAEPATDPSPEPAAEQTAGHDLCQVTAWVRDNIETLPEPAEAKAEVAAPVLTPPAGAHEQPETGESAVAEMTPESTEAESGSKVIREVEAAVQSARLEEKVSDLDSARPTPSSAAQEARAAAEEEAPVAKEAALLTAQEPSAAEEQCSEADQETAVVAQQVSATSQEKAAAALDEAVVEQGAQVLTEERPVADAAPTETGAAAAAAAASEPAVNGHNAEVAADCASENSSDSGKGGSSASLDQASPSNTPGSAALQTTVFDFLIPQKLCGRLIGKNGTFVNLLKARTGAHVIIRLHPVKSSVKICSVDGTQSEVDACLKMIREKFPLNKFPAMTLEQLNRPTEQTLAVPDSQQLHLPQGVTCDVLVSAVVSAGQLFLQQHTHPTFRGLERLSALMNACYADGLSTPDLPRPVLASAICAAPVAGGWYRAQVVAFYPDTDELDVRFMDFGGYSRIPAAHARQIRTDFMSLPFQAEECYLANVMPVSDDGWSVESGAVFESLITDRALEAMVVGYAEDGTPFVHLYSIQGTEYGNNAISLVNQQLVDSGAARWVENQA